MIVEERIYTLQVGTLPEYLNLYEQEGLPIRFTPTPTRSRMDANRI